MKFIERLSLVIFSIIILILSIVVCLLVIGWINLSTLNVLLLNAINNNTVSNVMLGVSIVLILLALKNIFFQSSSQTKEQKEYSDGILMQNDNGQLFISKDTMQNLVSGIAKKFKGTENVEAKVILDKENNLNVQVTLFVKEDAIIKDLSSEMQIKIKEDIKRATDLDVTGVNIQIKNIASQEEETVQY